MPDATDLNRSGEAGGPGDPKARPPTVQVRAPKGTRDAYPEDVLRRRYITQSWRDTAIRHGFEEIEGPTFEHADLYAVKSGEGILGELFQAYSGKDPGEVASVQASGRAPYALRPEFTPSLARMYVAKYGKKADTPVTRWFTAGPYFRAERPQRGRLREFLQWNCDVIGTPEGEAFELTYDTEIFDVTVSMLSAAGLDPESVRLKCNSRRALGDHMLRLGIGPDRHEGALGLIDASSKLSREQFAARARELALPDAFIAQYGSSEGNLVIRLRDTAESVIGRYPSLAGERGKLDEALERSQSRVGVPGTIENRVHVFGLDEWYEFDSRVVRGLAYYTGTVFELIADGERAVAGGGRYDKLIELFGGAPTPACGFGMGDVVLGLLLEDKGLMPEGPALMEAVSRAPASVRPEAFVVTPDESRDDDVIRAVARLRRGVESERSEEEGAKAWDWGARYEPATGGVRPFHARRSDKATRNVGKLFKDALAQHARTFVVLEPDGSATIQDLDRKRKFEKLDVGEGMVRLPAMVASVLDGREPG
ncbi:MAG: hypothetical protein EA378_05820 [Phycisphaerales bacterium]|nr:MAG: hypothetical protein EA378_05820 [Phycisphaerales bacterium]